MWCLVRETSALHQRTKHTPGPGEDKAEGKPRGRGCSRRARCCLVREGGSTGQRGWYNSACAQLPSTGTNMAALLLWLSKSHTKISLMACPNQKHPGKAILCNVIQSSWHTTKPPRVCYRKAGPNLWAQVSLQTCSLRNGLHSWPALAPGFLLIVFTFHTPLPSHHFLKVGHKNKVVFF